MQESANVKPRRLAHDLDPARDWAYGDTVLGKDALQSKNQRESRKKSLKFHRKVLVSLLTWWLDENPNLYFKIPTTKTKVEEFYRLLTRGVSTSLPKANQTKDAMIRFLTETREMTKERVDAKICNLKDELKGMDKEFANLFGCSFEHDDAAVDMVPEEV
jgi:hypothetical protein